MTCTDVMTQSCDGGYYDYILVSPDWTWEKYYLQDENRKKYFMFYEMLADCAETITNTRHSVSHPRRIICLFILDHRCSKTIEVLSASKKISIYILQNMKY